VPVKKFIWSERCDQCGCAASERAGTDWVQGRRERPAGKFINTTAASGAALLEIETPAFDDSRHLVRTRHRSTGHAVRPQRGVRHGFLSLAQMRSAA